MNPPNSRPRPRIQRPSDAGPAVPVPTGARDILPEEMSELRKISDGVLGTFENAGYGQVATPALEFETAIERAGCGIEDSYRVVDQSGAQLLLRFDSTIPIARLAATRLSGQDLPLRLCYVQPVFRPVQPKRGESREFLQAGMELLGSEAGEGDAEAITLLISVLEDLGMRNFTVAVGDATVFPRLLSRAGLAADAREREAIMHELTTRDLVGLRREVERAAGVSDGDKQELLRAVSLRVPASRAIELPSQAMSALAAKIDPTASERVVFDLGIAREAGYYTGLIVEVYAEGIGFPIGGGGRYDNLVAQFGRDLPACGFALNLERVHIALNAQESL